MELHSNLYFRHADAEIMAKLDALLQQHQGDAGCQTGLAPRHPLWATHPISRRNAAEKAHQDVFFQRMLPADHLIQGINAMNYKIWVFRVFGLEFDYMFICLW